MRRLPKDELYRLHVEKFYTYQDLALHFRCSTETIRLNLDYYKIPRLKKGNSLARKLRMTKKELKDYLHDLYWNKNMSLHDIAEYLDLAQYTVWRNFNTMGIARRKPKNKFR